MVYVLYSYTYIIYEGDYITIQGVALDEEAAKTWVSEQTERINVTYDYEEFQPIMSDQ